MSRTEFRRVYRLARLGALGTCAMTLGRRDYAIVLEAFDLRLGYRSFCKHPRWPRTFDSLRSGFRQRQLAKATGGAS